MSIRQVSCPACGKAANIPAAMTNVKCPSCGTVWNANNPAASKPQAAAPNPSLQPESAVAGNRGAMIAAGVGAAMALLAIVGIAAVWLQSHSDSAPAAAPAVEQTIKPSEPQPYRVVDLPEDQRKRIYDDYRAVARTTVEQPLMVPQGGVRRSVEGMLDSVYERELNHFAALHDVSVDDIQEIIKEGDAKNWDPSPRSNATRDGKRVYPKEMSEAKGGE